METTPLPNLMRRRTQPLLRFGHGRLSRPAAGFVISIVAYAVLTAILWALLDVRQILDVALLYLLLTLVVSAVWGYRVGLVAALAADLLVNFFFIPPLFTFTVQEPANAAALAIFMAVAGIGASMLALLRRQVQVAEARRAETRVLLDLSQELAHSVSPRDALQRLCSAVARALGARGCAILRFDGPWTVLAATADITLSKDDQAMAEAAIRTGETIRFGAAAHSSVSSRHLQRRQTAVTFVPFHAASGESGVLRISGTIQAPPLVDSGRLLTAFGDEASLAVQRVRLAEEARHVEALQRADEFKSILLSSVSHDLRSPLTAIKASVGSLRDHSVDWSDEDTESFLETIESQTDRLTATVTGLLQMSRLEGGAVQPRLEPVAVLPLFEDALASVPNAALTREIAIDASSTLWVRADYSLVLQALVNLIENACRYATPGSRIDLRAEAAAGVARLTVQDQGPGIAPADIPHIFEKFYRGSTSTASKGSGLGLAIVDAMVKLSGGTIAVKSSPAGTVFTITLPLASPPAPHP